MKFKIKNLILPAVLMTQILPAICNATNLEASITFPTWASLGTNYGDWFTGIFLLLIVPASFFIVIRLAVFVVMSIVKAIGDATTHH